LDQAAFYELRTKLYLRIQVQSSSIFMSRRRSDCDDMILSKCSNNLQSLDRFENNKASSYWYTCRPRVHTICKRTLY